jgi:hypothetical protein
VALAASIAALTSINSTNGVALPTLQALQPPAVLPGEPAMSTLVRWKTRVSRPAWRRRVGATIALGGLAVLSEAWWAGSHGVALPLAHAVGAGGLPRLG